VHAILTLLYGFGWLVFWLIAVDVILFAGALAIALVFWIIDRLTAFGRADPDHDTRSHPEAR